MNRKDERAGGGRRDHDAAAPTGAAEPLLISERAAARMLGLSPRLVWSLRTSGQLPFVRVRSRVLYSPAALRQWVSQNTKGSGR